MRCLKIALMLVGLLAIVQQSQQFNLKTIKLLSQKTKSYDDTTYFGLIFAGASTEKAFNESGFFTFATSIDLLGRRFVFGSIYAAPVVYVRSASTPSIHVGITTQLLATILKLRGIIYVGTAGATNNSVKLGSVVVPKKIAFIGAWNWLSNNATEKGKLVFGKFNIPEPGENLLGSVAYEESYIYNNVSSGTKVWIPIDPEWLRYASKVKIDGGNVTVGLKGSSSDTYLHNPAYRGFLYNTFRVSTVDTSSAAAGFGALGNDHKFISFQGISNKAGKGSTYKTELANANVVKALAKFIWLLTVPRAHHEY